MICTWEDPKALATSFDTPRKLSQLLWPWYLVVFVSPLRYQENSPRIYIKVFQLNSTLLLDPFAIQSVN